MRRWRVVLTEVRRDKDVSQSDKMKLNVVQIQCQPQGKLEDVSRQTAFLALP